MEIQPLDLTQIVVAVITTAGLVYSARRHHKQAIVIKTEPRPRKVGAWIAIMSIGLILLAANLGVFVWRYWGPANEVKIEYPLEASSVQLREMVRGTSQNVPKGQVVWVVVHSQEVGLYYPQNHPADVQIDGDWTSLAFIGVEEDVGNKFDIIAVIADVKVQDRFNSYLAQAKGEEVWPGLETFPEGTVICDHITVTRK